MADAALAKLIDRGGHSEGAGSHLDAPASFQAAALFLRLCKFSRRWRNSRDRSCQNLTSSSLVMAAVSSRTFSAPSHFIFTQSNAFVFMATAT
jgi:hypothetical protein